MVAERLKHLAAVKDALVSTMAGQDAMLGMRNEVATGVVLLGHLCSFGA